MSKNISSPSSPAYKKRASTRIQGKKYTAAQRQEVQEKFLKAFASNGIVRVACIAAGVDRSTVRYWEEHDEKFSMRYNLAKVDVDDAIRGEIFKRAMLGEDETTTEHVTILGPDGKPTETRQKTSTSKRKSDTLLIFHAKARMPEYRDKQQVEVSGSLTIKTEWGVGANDESEVLHGSNS